MTTTEIARLAGVSQATVSRVINQQPGVSEDNIRAVRTVMKRAQYKPRQRNWRAGPPANRKSGNIALLVLDDSYMVHSTLAMQKLQGVSRALREAGYNIIFGNVEGAADLPSLVVSGKVDGLLLWGQRAPPGVMAKLGNLPTVWLTSHTGEGNQGTLVGNEAVGRIAAEYLIQQGCHRLILLNVTNEVSRHRARGDGFLFAAHQAGLPVKIITGDAAKSAAPQGNSSDIEARVARLSEKILGAVSRADGLFVPSDQIMAIVHRLLRAHQVDLRKKMRLISAGNDEPYLLGLDPRPATIDLGPELTGRCAVQQLLWKITNPHETSRIQVTVEAKLVPGSE